ncbi:uncharacterized protein V1518DRAFT_419464 [Limtongia smithiae]|uniref:uncharacterized protein n=1 Tax=Limtongia smithiae TaxID=1125753 RepID=UPI0034D00351
MSPNSPRTSVIGMPRRQQQYSRLPRNPSVTESTLATASSASAAPRASLESLATSGFSVAVTSAAGAIPASPPPSFRSTASYMPIQPDDPLARSFDMPENDDDMTSDAEDDYFYRHSARTAAAALGSASTAAHDSHEGVRLLDTGAASSSSNAGSSSSSSPASSSSSTASASSSSSSAGVASHANMNDGVFANIMAKPEAAAEKPTDENPPSYEEAAADATPPYWETTILAPGMSSDDVYIDGLPVGSVFNFAWNMLISTSFQFVGFLLTYLLHTTHAAKNGSRAGLGVTLIQYGVYMHSTPSSDSSSSGSTVTADAATVAAAASVSPNSYEFQSSSASGSKANGTGGHGGSDDGPEWLSYALIICGFFLLVKSLVNFQRVRKMEQVILRGPNGAAATTAVAEIATVTEDDDELPPGAVVETV